MELPGAQVHPGQADGLAVEQERGEVVVVLALEQRVLGHGAGRDHARHVAVHQPLGLARVLDLVAEGDLVSGLDEALDVGVHGMVRHAGHRDGLFALAARGQRQAEQPRGEHRVVVEHLVEIPEAEEQERAGILRLDLLVLPHHGGLRHEGLAARSAMLRAALRQTPNGREIRTRFHGPREKYSRSFAGRAKGGYFAASASRTVR